MTDDALRVLHVDDQSLWRSTVSDYLTLYGNYQITSADSGVEALSLLQRESFDIIVSDFQMPEMDGLQFLQMIRSQGYSTPFILFTGIKREELEIRAKYCGAAEYLVKTGDPEVLFSELDKKIQQSVTPLNMDSGLPVHPYK